MLRCKEFVEQFAADCGDSSWRQRWPWRAHVWMCAGCRRFAEQIRWIGRTARALSVSPLSPADDAAVRAVRERALAEIERRRE